MKKDINPPKVENVAFAVVQEKNEHDEDIWNVYVVNLKDEPLESALVSATGYGELDGDMKKTTTLRYFLGDVKANSFTLIEPIMEDVFSLHNEYWLTFYNNKVLHDKKYIFLAESIKQEHLTDIPLINKKGVLIQ
ncbi:MAG: hypothetical protein ACJAUV_000512 [Flavobacteriales bacterium]|jgi:hypothetical protein